MFYRGPARFVNLSAETTLALFAYYSHHHRWKPRIPLRMLAEAPAVRAPDATGPELRAVRALLAAERANAHRALPPNDASWRFLLALYEAELAGRRLTPAGAAEAAAVPRHVAETLADHFETQDYLVRAGPGTLRLTETACGDLATWVYVLNPLPGLNPYPAAAGVPHPAPPR